MKRSGILNAALAGQLARLGHTDRVLVCDSGMPIPAGVEVVDLAFRGGRAVLRRGAGRLCWPNWSWRVAVAASEVGEANPACAGLLGSGCRAWSTSRTRSSNACRAR
ncbi:hypothetical protein GCM10020219_021300 [Nonomuraea dietziae]